MVFYFRIYIAQVDEIKFQTRIRVTRVSTNKAMIAGNSKLTDRN